MEKLDQSEPEYKSSVGFFTDNELAVLTTADLAHRRKARMAQSKHLILKKINKIKR